MINNEIKSEMVSVVNNDGKGVKVMKLTEAMKIAESQGLDVICINDKADTPIVKIMDYGKFQYEKAKRAKDNKKKARLNAQDTKEIVISDSIAEHDLMIKAKNIDRILKDGDKVRLTIRYKGRSVRLINQGPEKLQALTNYITANYKVDKAPKIEGNKVTMCVAPVKGK